MRWNESVQEGMFVTGTNGEKLGKVIRCDDESFIVEKGMFFPKDYQLRYEYVAKVDGKDITYRLTGAQPGAAEEPERSAKPAEADQPPEPTGTPQFRAGPAAEPEWNARPEEARRPPPARASQDAPAPEPEWRAKAAEARQPTAQAGAPSSRGEPAWESERSARTREANEPAAPRATPASEDASARPGDGGAAGSRLALMDEELDIEKVPRETGHVRVKKVVRTEEKHVTVPVRREDVVIERVPVSRDAAALSASEGGYPEPKFEEQTIDILLHEEELQVTKRPVVREEVVIRTVMQAGEKEAVAELRHEDAEFEDTRAPSQRRPEGRESSREPRGYSSPGGRR